MSHVNNLFDEQAEKQLREGMLKLRGDVNQLLGSGVPIDSVKQDVESLVNNIFSGLDRHDGKEDGFIEKATLEKAQTLFKNVPNPIQGAGIDSIIKGLADADGRVSVAEGTSRLSKALGSGVDEVAARFDQNNDGILSATEMVFSQLDSNGDNSISFEEARTLAENMQTSIPADQAAGIFSKFDADGDALLSRSEVQAVFNKMQKMPAVNIIEKPDAIPSQSTPAVKNKAEPGIKN